MEWGTNAFYDFKLVFFCLFVHYRPKQMLELQFWKNS